MKYGVQAIHAWSERAGVENVSRFLIDLAVEAESAGVTWFLEGIFGLRCDREEALEIVRRGPPDL